MKILESEKHDSLCATYQTLELARLNDALKKSGVADAKLRRQICERYFFDSGYFIDNCWFADQGSRFRPCISFLEVNDHAERTGNLYLPEPSVGTMLHEYAHGAAAWLYDDHGEDASEIETGDAAGQE